MHSLVSSIHNFLPFLIYSDEIFPLASNSISSIDRILCWFDVAIITKCILWIWFYVSTFIFFTPIKIGKTKYIMQSNISHHLLKDWKNMLVCVFYFSTKPNNFNGSSIHIQRIAGPLFFCLIARKIVEQTIIKAFVYELTHDYHVWVVNEQ